jgi:hypothetical protein
MDKRLLIFVASLLSILAATIIVGLLPHFGRAAAAPPVEREADPVYQAPADRIQFFSISALVFQPAVSTAVYNKDLQRQILSLTGQNRNFFDASNIFVAPLLVPDRTKLLGATLFGEDFDNQGEVRLRLKRCDHSQARCVILAETTSTTTLAAGQFQTPSVAIPNETVDNRFFTYFWELELTALFNSGARSVRLEASVPDATASIAQGQWSLTGDTFSFALPNNGITDARICTDDLSHLNNPTHYPFVVVDSILVTRLTSNVCETVRGRDIEIQRDLNTGSSSGTYEFVE